MGIRVENLLFCVNPFVLFVLPCTASPIWEIIILKKQSKYVHTDQVKGMEEKEEGVQPLALGGPQ